MFGQAARFLIHGSAKLASVARRALAIHAAALLANLGAVPAHAQDAGPVPVKREILALYDGTQEGTADGSRIHRFAELPLNHLGFIVRFHDMRTRLPDPAVIERYRGVLTWFTGPVPDTSAYLAWAAQVSGMRLNYVVLGDVGAELTPRNLFLINRLFGAIGLRHSGDFVSPTRGTKLLLKDQELLEFECRLDPILPDYPVVETVDRDLRTGLSLQVPARDGTAATTLVAIGAKGGYAAFNYEFCHQRAPTHRGRWLIDPFAFFRAAFGDEPFPVPDVTTVSGRRLFFSQLRSVGWSNESGVERYRRDQAIAAEVVLRELIEPFPDMPVTLDLQDGDLDRLARTARQARAIAQRLLALPHVERPGSRVVGTKLSRFDVSYPSISSLSALKSSAEESVYYTAASDEIAYAGKDQRASAGFQSLTETLSNTEWPRRLKGFNLNYHVFAGQRPASLQAVKDHLLAARKAGLSPVATSHYAAIVDGFDSAKVERDGPSRWLISNRGALQTVRLDAADGREVDLAASTGVLGARRHGAALYVALDETVETASIVLETPVAGNKPAGSDGRLALIESRWRVRGLVQGQCYQSFEAQGYGQGEFVWSGAEPGRHKITVARGGEDLLNHSAVADRDGRLAFVLPVQAIEPVTVQVICNEIGGG